MDKSHHLPNGKGFRNPWPSFKDFSFSDFIYLFRDWTRNVPIPSPEILAEYIVPVDLKNLRTKIRNDQARLTWLGHATFLLQLQEMCFIFDPIFSERCSASQLVGPKRYIKPLIIESRQLHANFQILWI